MSLANDNDIIIPDTTGTVTALSKEANQHNSKEKLTKYITEITKVYSIVSGRIQGKPLNQLVNPARISSEKSRIEEKNETIEQEMGRAYESWFRE